MKRTLLLLGCLLPLLGFAADQKVRDVSLEGAIVGENLTVTLKMGFDDLPVGGTLLLAEGPLALLDSVLPRGVEIRRDGDRLLLACVAGGWLSPDSRSGRATVTFAVRASASGDWRQSEFVIPIAPIRPVAVVGDRPDLEVRIAGAREIRREPLDGGRSRTSGFLGQGDHVVLSWKPEVRQFDSELLASCDAVTVASVGAGALHLTSVYTYQIAQGALSELVLDAPDATITQVSGEDIRDWRVDKSEPKAPKLRVSLGRPQRATYRLTVDFERAVPAFPCTLPLPVISPRAVIRAGGVLLLGTDNAIRIQPAGAVGLTQTDPTSFPRDASRTLPQRNVFTYQYAAMPYHLSLSLDDIVPAFDSEAGLILNVREGELTFEANVQLDVRDAPLREVKLLVEADAKWIVAAVTGPQVAECDVDIRNIPGGREIVVPFRQPVSDAVALRVRLEQPFAADRSAVAVPRVALPAARTQRGYLIAAAAKGLRLTPKSVTELRDVHTASTPVRIEGAQLAYRFRETPWKLELGVERARPAIHSEVFHLVSLGEGVMYVSAAITCHISGAPVQQLRFRVPSAIASIDVIGAGIDTWSRSNDVCSVSLANRAMGDYTLLLTYDQPLNYRGADLRVGEIETLGTDSEMGYIAVATASGLKLTEVAALPPTLIRIARDELPPGYAASVSAPVIGAYKYVRTPHAATLRITPLDTARAIDQVVDYLSLSTRLGRDGESQTRACYSIKNASRQYLSVKLPPDASLWYVRQALPNGKTRDLPAQQTHDLLLVPVDRPRDPNQAVSIEITYGETGHASHRVRLIAPSLPESPVTYTSWEVTAGDRLAIGHASGNVTPSEEHSFRLPLARGGGSVCRFYRTANLAGEEPLFLNVLLVPVWMAGGSVYLLFIAGVLGMALLVCAVIRRRPLWWALALTALGLAAAQTMLGMSALRLFVLPAALLVLLFLLTRALARWIRRRVAARQARAEDDLGEPPPLMSEPPDANPRSGAIACRFLLVLGAAAALTLPAFARKAAVPATEAEALPALQAQGLDLNIRAPAPGPLVEHTATVGWMLRLADATPGRYRILAPASVLVQSRTPRGTAVSLGANGYVLEITRSGDYEIELETREPIAERDGRYELPLTLPSALWSHFTFAVPAADMEFISDQALNLTATTSNGETRVAGVLDTSCVATLAWRPRARVTRLEQTVVYCDVETVAFVRPGAIDLSACANYQVVQGEVREVRLRIPTNLSVTTVAGPLLAAWSLDPATRQLVAVLSRPVSGAFALTLGMQAASGGMPYAATLGVPFAENVQRQRGQLALAAAEAILLRLGEPGTHELEGVTAINTGDFSPSGEPACLVMQSDEPLRRAFRYDDPAAVRVVVRAEPVQPEVRVSESSSFSLGDERNVLSTVLELAVAKSGVFSVRLQIPEGYDIETLTGRDVSHWDDVRRAGQGVEVFFKRRVLGATTLNLVLTRMQRGIPERLAVPRVSVQDAARHTGRMTVAAERGVRLTVEEQQSVSVRKPELGEKVQPSALSFEILRPGWQVTLGTQVLAPVLKPEILHRVELAEGMLQHRVYVSYRIENAGVKFFRLRVPVKQATLSVSGKNIASVAPLDDDPAAGDGRVWLVELHGKVEDKYTLTCFYQQPYDPTSGGVTIHSFDALGAARQPAARLVVTGGGRVQVEPRGVAEGLQPEDARRLPEVFNAGDLRAGDLSGAIRCYRALRSDYHCDLSVVRHDAATVLPASVEKSRFVTVLSSSGRMLTQATIDLKVGDLSFLKLRLPTPTCVLWCAQVNGAEVRASRDGDLLDIPLENLTVDRTTSVTLVYADRFGDNTLAGRRILRAPCFPDVPLRDISWNFFVPPEFHCRFLDGDLDIRAAAVQVRSWGLSDYEIYNKTATSGNLGVAVDNLKQVNGLLDSGRQKEAQQALQLAVNASQSDQSLNEDARVQLRNVAQRQVKMGLVNRRAELRQEHNIFDELMPQAQGFNGGNFNPQFAAQVEGQLSAQDNAALDRVAGRFVDQQAAAAGQGTAINIAIPEHGRELDFFRNLQGEKGGELKLVLAFDHPSLLARALALWPVLVAFLALWGALKLLGRKQ